MIKINFIELSKQIIMIFKQTAPIFNQTLILFFLLMIGFIIRRLEIVDRHLNDNLTNLIIYVTLPALIINSMDYEFSLERLNQLGVVLVGSVFIFFIMIAVSWLVSSRLTQEGKERSIYRFILIFANVGFMGYPVVEVIFGQQGVFLATVYNLVFNLFIWTLGVLIMCNSQEGEKAKIDLSHLVNPGIISIGIGFLIFLFSLELPSSISHTLHLLGETTTPLAMIVVGNILAQVKIREIFSNLKLWLVTGVRLVLLPLLVLAILQGVTLLIPGFSFSPLLLGVLVVLTGMPAVANTAIFAQKFGSDEALASEGVFLTTLLSLVTIPLIVYLTQL
ncbi:MAG: AEC family transporter [Halanaerobacter sp.]